MPYISVETLLDTEQLAPPDFPFLIADPNFYKILLLQPKGEVEAHDNRVGPRDLDNAHNQNYSFLKQSITSNVDLTIIPEYCCSVVTLTTLFTEERYPAEGKLWVIGGQSVTFDELRTFQENVPENFRVLWDTEIENRQGNFVDPVFLIFQAKNTEGNWVPVVLVQFKTEPMGDQAGFERNNMKQGRQIYIFNSNKDHRIRLATLVCSDTLSQSVNNNYLNQLHGNSIVLHIQLNANPRSDNFKRYRDVCFGQGEDTTEVLCVNWSTETSSRPPSIMSNRNFCGSAFYMKPRPSENLNDIERNEQLINENHKKGLYATYWREHKTYTFFLNSGEAAFLIKKRKPYQRGAAQQIQKPGPEILDIYAWDTAQNRWNCVQDDLDDRFRQACAERDEQLLNDLHTPAYNPLSTERLLNISTGRAIKEEWFRVNRMPTCEINRTEKVKRITYAEDASRNANSSRQEVLGQFAQLKTLLETADEWPINIQYLRDHATLSYTPSLPNRNLHSPQGSATVIHAGNANKSALEEIYSQTLHHLRREDTSEDLNAVAIWSTRADGQSQLYMENARPETDRDPEELPGDIDGGPRNA